MAELVDAADSKSAIRKDVLVRFQSRALDYEGLRQRQAGAVLKFANNLQTIEKRRRIHLVAKIMREVKDHCLYKVSRFLFS